MTSAAEPRSHTLRTGDGVCLAADLYPGASPDTAIVLVHGLTAHRRHDSVVTMSGALLADGHTVVCYDGRGHGDSEGVCSLGDEERLDVAAAVELARSDADRVVVVGASMGAIAALHYAATDDELDGVVTVSCPARWQLRTLRTALAAFMTQTSAGRQFLLRTTGVRMAQTYSRGSPPEVVAAQVTCPLAIVHGLGDRFLPSGEAKRLHRTAIEPRRLDLVPAMGHAFDDVGTSTIVAAVSWCLKDR